MAYRLKLPYGLHEGELLHVSQVETGLACRCICPGCGAALVARNAAKNLKVAHFAHHKAKECATGLQTALHLAAKDIIARHKQLRLPGVSGHFRFTEAYRASFAFDLTYYENYLFESTGYDDEVGFIQSEYADASGYFFASQVVPVDEVILEKRTGDIVPDVLVRSGHKWIMVEIAVTHFVDDAKQAKIKALDLPALEIDLSNMRRNITDLTELEVIIIDGEQQKKWLNNPELRRVVSRRRQQYFDLCRPELERLHAVHSSRIAQETARAKYRAELAAKSPEERAQIAQRKQVFYSLHLRPLTWRGASAIGPVQHVDGCPKGIRYYFEKPYANVEADCFNCHAFRGYNTDRTAIVCLFDYLKRKEERT